MTWAWQWTLVSSSIVFPAWWTCLPTACSNIGRVAILKTAVEFA
jgi:hypothetical protein